MEFKRINKDTVNCIITEDDMDEQGIKLEDLFEKKKEALDFLHDVMLKAQEEVDYKPTGSFMPLQITVLPDHSISLTLSENASASFGEILRNLTEKAGVNIPKNVLEDIGDAVDEDRISRLNDYLKSLKNLTNSMKNIINKESVPINVNGSSDKNKNLADSLSVGAKRKAENRRVHNEENLKQLQFSEFVFTFDSFMEVKKFCAKAPMGNNICSTLYKNEETGKYFLDIRRGDEDTKKFASLFTMAYEFGHFQCSAPQAIAYIRESYDCIIRENAIEHLAQMF
ncbi:MULTISPECIES: adaptor protein MecA [Butyrivibrio]|uniref:adaptor protein MecA n=1 Tax=Butyrivibrio TaxID=830 RepID=UPI000422E296|nr:MULTISPECIES: adaptor protein MecA [Butyrivibrio]